jgi:hypothetical protein
MLARNPKFSRQLSHNSLWRRGYRHQRHASSKSWKGFGAGLAGSQSALVLLAPVENIFEN